MLPEHTQRTSDLTNVTLQEKATNCLAEAWVLKPITDKREWRPKIDLDFRNHPYCWEGSTSPDSRGLHMEGGRNKEEQDGWIGVENWQPNNLFNVDDF